MIDCFIFDGRVYYADKDSDDVFKRHFNGKLPPIFRMMLSNFEYGEFIRDECIFVDSKTMKDDYPEHFI